MFVPKHWAVAFINFLAAQDVDAKEGLAALMTLDSWVSSLPGAVFGSSAAEKLEKIIREGMANSGNCFPATEAALRLVVLMVRRNVMRHAEAVIDEIKKILDKKHNVIHVSAEYAFLKREDESRIMEAIRKRTGAARVDITGKVNPELIGGYRLRIGDEIIDASVRSQLRKLELCLAAGIGGEGGN